MPLGVVQPFQPVHVERRDRGDSPAEALAVNIESKPVPQRCQRIQVIVVGAEEEQQEDTADHHRFVEVAAPEQRVDDGCGHAPDHAADQDPAFRLLSFIEAAQDQAQDPDHIQEGNDEHDVAQGAADEVVIGVK